MKKEQRVKRNPKKILIRILIAVVAVPAGLFIFHKIKHGIDMKYLAERGYYNPVSIGDRSLNVLKFGNEEGIGSGY